MKQSSNLGLALYDKTDLMNITGLENSLNHNMELIDLEISQLSQNKADASILGNTIKAFGEVGVDNHTVVYATVCLKKLTDTKCDLYISYKIDSNTQASNFWHFMSYNKICSLLGITSFSSTDARNSQVSFEESISMSGSDLTVVSPINDSNMMGYTGIHAILNDQHDLQLCRVYTENGDVGCWELTMGIFAPGTYGKINFYGANYSI